jgi:hypothetical protein
MKFVKFHLPLHMVSDIRKFGVPSNFSSGPGESRHKTICKNPARRTQGQKKKLDYQTADRYSEFIILQRAMSEINSGDLPSASETNGNHPRTSKVGGKVYLLAADHSHVVEFQHSGSRKLIPARWAKDSKQEALLDYLLSEVIPAMRPGSLQLRMLTEYVSHAQAPIETKIIYRANPNWKLANAKGEVWRDWAYVDGTQEHDLAVHLQIFLQLSGLERAVTDHTGLLGDVHHDGDYAVVHVTEASPWGSATAGRPPSWSHPSSRIVTEGRLKSDPAECETPIYALVHVSRLRAPCIAVPRHLWLEAENLAGALIEFPNPQVREFESRTNQFLSIAPRSSWGDIVLNAAKNDMV